MVDVGAAYLEAHERLRSLLLGLDDDQAASPVRRCPGWSVRDTFAQVVDPRDADPVDAH